LSTYAAFAAAFGGLTITNVKRKYDHTPVSIGHADLPAMFVRLPNGNRNSGSVSTCSGSGKGRTIEMVVCVEAVGLNNAEPNFDSTVAMMDAVEAAIDAMAKPMPIMGYDLRGSGVVVGDTGYWAVVATITGQNY
jgi:hypothetical protein